VDATPPAIPENAVFASWLYDRTGLLLLGDLLPLSARANETNSPGLELSVTLPAGWSVVSSEENWSPGQYHVIDVVDAVFAVGSGLREGSTHSEGINTRVGISGAWSFADNDLFALVTNILSEHAKTLDPAVVGMQSSFFSHFRSHSLPSAGPLKQEAIQLSFSAAASLPGLRVWLSLVCL